MDFFENEIMKHGPGKLDRQKYLYFLQNKSFDSLFAQKIEKILIHQFYLFF